MKNVLSKLLMLILFSSIISMTSCKKDEHNHDGQEVITTLKITFNQAVPPVKLGTVSESTVFKYFILEGEDAIVTITGPNLIEDIAYNYSIEVLNEEDEDNIENLTSEIEDEADDHLFCITGGNISGQNNDSNGKVFGSQGVITFSNSGENNLKIILKHEPNKNAANPCLTGDTDIEAIINHTVNLLI